MNTTNDDRLKAAAQGGDINLLYTVIQEDPHVLEHIDSIPFIETPLHTAASCGQLQFATEVMRLKPSFAWKLNQQGFSPIHLAMQQDQKRMVLRFVDIDKDLVRLKGREGLTPLHFASQTGDVDLLASFLDACPESIKDVTVRGETALHIAVKSKQYEALQVLVGWLERNDQKGAWNLEKTTLNWKDEAGNTILHISALNNDSQALRLLVKTRMDLNAKNMENSTALDIAANAEIKSILWKARAEHGSSVTYTPTLADKLRTKITVWEEISIRLLRNRRAITEEQRNAYLVVVALLVSATFQSALSPPGGVYQANAGDNNVNSNTTSLNSTTTAGKGKAGTSVMSEHDFSFLAGSNGCFLVLLAWMTLMLTPSGKVGYLLYSLFYWLLSNYSYSMMVISPTSSTSRSHYQLHYAFLVFYLFLNCTHLMASGQIPGLARLFRKVRKSYNILLARLQLSN